jgi:hypothetical protein
VIVGGTLVGGTSVAGGLTAGTSVGAASGVVWASLDADVCTVGVDRSVIRRVGTREHAARSKARRTMKVTREVARDIEFYSVPTEPLCPVQTIGDVLSFTRELIVLPVAATERHPFDQFQRTVPR